MRRLLSLILLLAAPFGHAQAPTPAEAPSLWQLDLIAFERVPADAYGDFDDTWRFQRIDWPDMLPLAASRFPHDPAAPPPFQLREQAVAEGIRIQDQQQSQLQSAVSKLQGRSRFRVLSHHSLRFAKKMRTPRLRLQGGEMLRLIARDTREQLGSGMDYWLSAPDLEPPVDTPRFLGWVRLDHDIHPILELDLSLQTTLPGIYPLQTDPDGRQEFFRDQVQQYRMRQERRLKPGGTAYFDHPRLGLLVRLTAIQPASAESPAP